MKTSTQRWIWLVAVVASATALGGCLGDDAGGGSMHTWRDTAVHVH
ncbi:MAG: hypothetical protein PHU25_14150 [Deltaproteobacteria bacterium]|nr:hypothetical protein [Deltaproteobacteria bacterium]